MATEKSTEKTADPAVQSEKQAKSKPEKYEGNNIERLFESGNLHGAMEKFAEFLRLCDECVDSVAYRKAQLLGLETEEQALRVGTEAAIFRNKINMGFQSHLSNFRKNVLAEYFELRGQMEFLIGITERDQVIHKILDLRLLPKRYQRDDTWDKVEGNSSIIFRLFNPDTQRHAIAMVIKMPVIGKKTQQQIELLADLRHRNIIKLLDYEIDSFPFFIISEFVYGENLPDALSIVGPRPVSQAADWLYQLAEALEYLRHKRVIHTNVRPSKIYIDDEWQIMISPFDLIKISASSSRKGGQSDTDNPSERTFNRYLDVCQYGSPELLRKDGESLGLDQMCIADLYSLGLIGYKLLTGKDLFAGKYLFEILENRRKFETDPSEREEKLSKLPSGELADIIRDLLEFDADKRSAHFPPPHALNRKLTPLTRQVQGDPSLTRQSYRRCLASNKEFIRDFYRSFFEKKSAKGQAFGSHFNEMARKRQGVMLQMAVDILLDLENRQAYFIELIDPKKKSHQNFMSADFETFIDTLIDTVRENDKFHWNEALEHDWKEVREKSMKIIREVRKNEI